jgi:pyruvate kinase
MRATDAIMVARGDLGIETPLECVPMVQKDLIRRANRASKPVITATQMLESMIANARPTRAEATDVANAILDGTDAVMLSGETARGAYPLEAVRMMATIATEVERTYPHTAVRRLRAEDADRSAGDIIATSIAEAAVRIADRLALRVIVTPTSTGNTARYVSTYRPQARVIGMTPFASVARRMALSWGVESLVVPPYPVIDALISVAEERVVAEGIADSGETIIITSGMPVGTGGTNLLRIHRLP